MLAGAKGRQPRPRGIAPGSGLQEEESVDDKQRNGQGLTRILRAARCSREGLRAAWRNEAAFRQEAILAAILMPLALWLGDSGVERALLAASVPACVLVCGGGPQGEGEKGEQGRGLPVPTACALPNQEQLWHMHNGWPLFLYLKVRCRARRGVWWRCRHGMPHQQSADGIEKGPAGPFFMGAA